MSCEFKTRINPRIDTQLVKLMKLHVMDAKISQQDFIAEAIAEKLGVPLNLNHMIPESDYEKHDIQIDSEIKKLDKCINKLTEKRQRLEAEKDGGVI